MSINNSKTVAPAAAAAPTMMAALAKAKARKAEAKASLAAELRQRLENAVGKNHDIPRLEFMRTEARDVMECSELEAFEAELDNLIEVRKDLEKAEAEAKRLQAVATTQGMSAHLDRKVEAEQIEKELKARAKVMYAEEAEIKAKEDRIARIIGDLGDITPGQRGAVTVFLRGNPWDYHANPKGRAALLAAAGRAAAEFNKQNKIKAKAAKAAKAAAAPLTQKLGLK